MNVKEQLLELFKKGYLKEDALYFELSCLKDSQYRLKGIDQPVTVLYAFKSAEHEMVALLECNLVQLALARISFQALLEPDNLKCHDFEILPYRSDAYVDEGTAKQIGRRVSQNMLANRNALYN